MTDIATLQARLEELKKARASGHTSVSFEGKSVSYRNDLDLAKAIYALESEIDKALGVRPVRNVVLRSPSDRGW